MIDLRLNIDGEDYNFELPESWEDIKVKDFSKIIGVQEKDNLNGLERIIEIINVISGIPVDLIMMIPITEFNKITEKLAFVNEDIKAQMKDSIIVNGEEYFLKKDFDNLTMGEIITIEMLVEETGGNIFKALDKLLCVFLRKKRDNGKLEMFKTDMLERSDIFKDISITEIYQLMIFFSTGRVSLENSTVDSSEKKERKKKKIDLKA